MSSRQILSALVAALVVAEVKAAMGPAFSTGPVADDTFIRESWATLVLPNAPSDNSGVLSLWVGMGTSNGDLVQSIADNWASEKWSVYAYTLMSTGDEYDDNSGNYTQTVLLNGEVVSTLSTSDGKAQGWGSAVECAAEDCGTVPAHTWLNCSIILDSADMAYSNTLALGTDVEGSMTSEDGITWTIGTINIPGWSFTTESVVESSSDSSASSPSASTSASYSTPTVSPSYGAIGSTPSGTSDGASSSGSVDTPASQPSKTSGEGSYGGSPGGATPTNGGFGGFGSGSRGSRPTGSWGSWGARPTGGFGGFGSGSATGAAPDASASSTPSWFGGGWWNSRMTGQRQ
ncbi:hypothetical protein KVR01_008947 [Diaporthe batatas]|uniref:uncharacterized protein n=1 Tax=Diaporthe batatas TaxID=748121 RepID=UPI001D03C119|nr:uncharacterized protein KVR01_008947 [Diaporthe batatas]KAG8160683.1 hypothetical protein KVR01_008947 [Diaporthe batatas]